MKNAIVIGATSGIGRELAVILSQHGYAVGLAGRRLNLLEELKSQLKTPAFIKRIDISIIPDAMRLLNELISEMGEVDLIVISSGIGFINPDLLWEHEKNTIDVNVLGFTAMANVAFQHFKQIGRGHLVGISSIAAIFGHRGAPAYNASKAFVSNYLEGLRNKAIHEKLDITVTDIKPGFVDTAMAISDRLFWLAPVHKASWQIYRAIEKKKSHAYITKRWTLAAWLLNLLPRFIRARL
jgi:short-subunit dehydrogenase